jgi:phage FluMu protein Com
MPALTDAPTIVDMPAAIDAPTIVHASESQPPEQALPPPLPFSESLEPAWSPPPEHRHDDEPEQQPETFTCPVCMGQGWFPFEPPRDPRTQTCPRCMGHGKVLTGSHVEGHIVRECPDCEALGYVEVREEAPQVTAAATTPSPSSPEPEWDRSEQEEVPSPAAGQSPPWTGAVWDESRGTYQ